MMTSRRTTILRHSIILFVVVSGAAIAVNDVTPHALFFASPNDVTSYTTGGGGVASVLIDYRHGGETREMPFGYGCQTFGRYTIQSLRIRSMSFDPVSERVLIHLFSKDDSRITLALGGSPCSAVPTVNCSPTGANGPMGVHGPTVANDTSLEFLYYEAKTIEHAKVGPFAYFNSTVFFLLQRFEKPDYRTRLNVIELRRMLTVCADGTRLQYPVTATNSAFEVLDCSALVLNVVEERYDAYHAYRPLDALVVVPSTVRGYLDFYFQLQRLENRTDTSVDVSVVLGHGSTRSAASTVPVHEQPVDSGYLKYLLFQLGGLSHRQRNLCWAAIDRVFCGRLDDDGHVVDPRIYLDVGDVANVCKCR